MGGIFGVVSRKDIAGDLSTIESLFFGTDYHSHMGTKRGGMSTYDRGEFFRYIHDITNAQFRSKFEDDVRKFRGRMGIGAISDYEDQPLVIRSHLGRYGIVSINRLININDLVESSLKSRKTHYAETGKGEINPTEVLSTLINEGLDYTSGIRNVQDCVRGSASMLLLTDKTRKRPAGIYAARDSLGRTPLIIGRKKGSYAVTSESCALPNTGFEIERELGPGEIVFITPDGIEREKAPNQDMQMCSFLWVYFGYPASSYEEVNVEDARNRCGAALARADAKDIASGKLQIDMVAGIPDSGTGHAIGYANESKFPYGRPFVKYTPTWPRSFMPPDQEKRDLIARMKLIPVKELLRGKSILFCEDSIVRGTQLRDTIKRLYNTYGVKQIHMRPACPPLIYGCDFLNFSRSKTANELAAQRAIRAIHGIKKRTAIPKDLLEIYANPDSAQNAAMVEWIRADLNLATLKYQRLDDLVEAIGIPKEKLCTHCWDGTSRFSPIEDTR